MKYPLVIQLILVFFFKCCFAQEQSLPIKSTTEVDEVLGSKGKKIAFTGRIHSFEFLGDSILLLKCEEYHHNEKSLLVVIKKKDIIAMAANSTLAGEWITVQGPLQQYNGSPAMILDHKPNSSTVKLEEINSIPKQPLDDYQSQTHLDLLFKSYGKNVRFLGKIFQINDVNDSLRVINCKEFSPTEQSINVVLIGKQFKSSNDKLRLIGLGISIQGLLTTYNDTPAIKFGKDFPETRLTVFKILDNTTKQAIVYDGQNQILYIK